MDPKAVIDDLVGRASAVGLATTELARRADIAPSTFNRWRKGETSPTLAVLARVEGVVADAEALARLGVPHSRPFGAGGTGNGDGRSA